MKVGIGGTLNSGKTTTTSLFSNAIINVEREAMQGKPIGEMTKKELVSFQYRVAEMQYSREQEMDNLITDNPLYLSPVYCKQIDADLYRRSLDFVKEKANYNLVFVCEPLPIFDDGIRHTSDTFQKKIHTDLIDVLNHFGIPFHPLSGSIEERKKKILSLIR